MSETDLCNLALDRLGINKTLGNVATDTSAEALACRRWYAQCRDEILQDFPWAFARRVVALAEVADAAAPGWEYGYRVPADCLRSLVLSDDQGLRVSAGNTWTVTDMRTPFWFVPASIPFVTMGDDAGRLLMTDLEDAYLWYTSKVTDVSQYDPQFKALIVAKLAVELAGSLKADPKLVQIAEQRWALAKSQAEATAANEQTAEPRRQSPSITVRA